MRLLKPRTANRTRHAVSLRFAACLALLWFAGCIPATTPDNLSFTPGSPVIVSDGTFTAADFSLRYPDGWRILNGAADAPQTVTFVSPDNCSIILVAVGSADAITSQDCGDVEFQSIEREISLPAVTITVAGSAPIEQWDAFLPQFEQMVATVQQS